MSHREHDLVSAARDLAEELTSKAADIEAQRRVPTQVSELLGRHGFYRMLVPRALGGAEVMPSVFASVLEELARGDAASAWVVMTGSTTGILLAYLAPSAAETILQGSSDAALAGVFAPTGKALPTATGYTLSGRWRWGSGCQNAAWRMGGALVLEDGRPRLLADGSPEIRSCFYRAADSQVIDTWNVSGLRGTGSHDLVVNDVEVPAEHTTCVLVDTPRHDGALYRFPVFGLLATGVAAVGLGIARAALDELEQLCRTRKSRGGKRSMAEGELVQVTVAKAEAALAAARALSRDTLHSVYERVAAGAELSLKDRAALRMAATHAASTAAQVVDDAYHLAGGASVWHESPLQRHFRDVHVMTQHVMVGPQTLKPVGRIFLGLETDAAQL